MRVSLTVVAAFVASASAMLLPDMTGQSLPEQYIVVYKKDVTDAQIASHENWLLSTVAPAPGLQVQGGNGGDSVTLGGDDYEAYGIRRKYNFKGFKGYAAKLPKEAVKDLSNDPYVDYIEEDKVVSILGEQKAPPSWGLQRISSRDLPLSKDFKYPDSAGANVTVYVIDTGIFYKHKEFEGRATVGKSFTKDGDNDGNGHGTHVAGTIGSKTYGIAKKVDLIAVKVLDARGSGQTSDVIGGIEFVAVEGPKKAKKGGLSVANMSLGGGKSRAIDNAVKAAIEAGIVFAVAAGNSAGDACKLSPAGVEEAVTVAASDKNDNLASFSEKGKCVDIIAPGVDITSTWNKLGGINTISGTSMASPHVAGVLALAIAEGNFTTPAQVKDYLKAIASKDRIKGNLRQTPNSLLFDNVKGGARPDDEPVEPEPVPEDPNDPGDGDGACPIPQCLFDPACTSCCIECLWFSKK